MPVCGCRFSAITWSLACNGFNEVGVEAEIAIIRARPPLENQVSSAPNISKACATVIATIMTELLLNLESKYPPIVAIRTWHSPVNFNTVCVADAII